MVAAGFNLRIQWTPALKGWATISRHAVAKLAKFR